MKLARWFFAAAAASLLPAAALAEACEPRHAASPQAADDCRFQNMANPQLKQGQTQWKIWSRFLTANKQGTVPVDPIPVRKLDRAALDAIDNNVGSSRVDLQACKLEYSIVSPK